MKNNNNNLAKKDKPTVVRLSKQEVSRIANKAKADNINKEKNGMIGIVFEAGKYRSRLKVKGKLLDLGRYATQIEAATLRNNYIITHGLDNTLCVIH